MKGSYVHRAIHILLLWLLFEVVMVPLGLHAQSREYLLKAGYIEKFTHFVDWPESSIASDSAAAFSITVIGENKFANAIEKIFSKARVKNRNVCVSYISSIDEIKECMILIVPESQTNALGRILEYTNGKPILTIGETKGHGKKGIMINMFIDNNYLRYEINRSALKKSGLRMSSLLLASAIILEENE
jgi:hypothetical protein